MALYSTSDASDAIRFIEEELLPFAEVADDRDNPIKQSELPDGDDETTECEECGRESDSVGDDGLCIVCRDKREEESGGSLDELDTVVEREGESDE